MAGGVRVFGTERGAKGIYLSQRRSAKLTFELSTHRERSLLPEKIIIIDYLPLLILFQVIEVLGGHLEHITCPLTVRSGDKRSVEIEETVFVEVGVDGHRHIVTYAEHGTKCIGTGTHVSHRTQIFPRSTFFLQRIGVVTDAQHFNVTGLYLASLTSRRAFYQDSVYTQAGSCGYLFQYFCIEVGVVAHHLHILDGAAIVEGNEEDTLRATL